MMRCIGCGAAEAMQPCIGACGDVKLELVPAVEHEEVLTAPADGRARAEALIAVVGRLASATAPDGRWDLLHRELRGAARAALRSLAPDGPVAPALDAIEPMIAWLCPACGRIEAPQQCLGVCTRRREEFVRADRHDALLARARETQRRARELSALVRTLAWVTPREGQAERTIRALRERARALLAVARVRA